MLQVSQFLMWVTVACYAAATVLYAYHFLSKLRSYSFYATFLTGAGFVSQTIAIGLRSSATGGTELSGPNSLVLASWAIVLVYFVVEHLVKLKVYGVVLVPVALLLLVVGLATGLNSGWQLSADKAALLESWQVGFHVFLIVFANAGFAIGAAASAAYLALERQLKSHQTSTLFKRLPSLAQTDVVARRAISIAFPVYTAGLTLGILRAIETSVSSWYFDARIMMAGVVWLIFGTYLFLHYRGGASGRTTAWVAIAGFIVVVIVAILARTLPAGFHVFAVAGS